MEFFEVIEKRRSVRELQKVTIPQEHILRILESGRLAPSGKNIQPWEVLVIDDEELIRQLASVQSFIGQAGVLIGIVADPRESKYWLEDAAATIENMLLAITALGYASCWIEGTLLRKEEWAKNVLGIPEEKRFLALLPLGKAAGRISPPVKKPLSSLSYYNQYGQHYLK